MHSFRAIVLWLIFFSATISYGSDCQKWFQKLNTSRDKACVQICESSKIDMSSFTCPLECKDLCKNNKNDEYSLLKLYGLTDDEIKLCDKTPAKCITAYRLSWDAENLCLKKYPDSRTNDESDASRHFVWAILMAEKLNLEFAEAILNAHENNDIQPKIEKAMDLSNNRLGLLSVQKMQNANISIDNDKILAAFERELNANSIIIIKSRYEKRK